MIHKGSLVAKLCPRMQLKKEVVLAKVWLGRTAEPASGQKSHPSARHRAGSAMENKGQSVPGLRGLVRQHRGGRARTNV